MKTMFSDFILKLYIGAQYRLLRLSLAFFIYALGIIFSVHTVPWFVVWTAILLVWMLLDCYDGWHDSQVDNTSQK